MTTPSSQSEIVVIDDHHAAFEAIEALLHMDGYLLHDTRNGAEGLAKVRERLPDVVLCDLMMPDMSGYEVCAQLKSDPRTRRIPVIMVTALNETEVLRESLAAGADDFLSKPFNRHELRARVRSMLRIRQQYRDLEAMIKMREELATMVVHDLRNPVTAMIFAAEVLAEQVTDPALEPATRTLVDTGARLHSMLNEILTVAKMSAGRLQLNKTEFCLTELCETALEGFRSEAERRRVPLEVDLPPKPTLIAADRNLLQRAVENLISNALRFSPEDSRVLMEVKRMGSEGFILEVSDGGPGVPESERERMRELFATGSPGDRAAIGLGLPFVFRVAQAHGGHFELLDNEPRGTRARVSLPLHAD